MQSDSLECVTMLGHDPAYDLIGSMRMADVVVIGGGVIGLSLAWELAGQGAKVTLFDRQSLGQEASWAGAGMLPPGKVASVMNPEQRLRSHSHELWQPLSEALADQTGIDNGFRICGALEVGFPGEQDRIAKEIETWNSEGVAVEPLDAASLRKDEHVLSREIESGYLLPEMGQIRNPRHLKALAVACGFRSVTMHSDLEIIGFETQGDRVTSVRTPYGDFQADQFCLTAGAWSSRLSKQLGVGLSVSPVRGQIVQLSTVPRVLTRIVQQGRRYFVPRPDGRLLIGATEEYDTGFKKQNTAGGVAELLQFAAQIAPCLELASIERMWSGLRPGSPDGLPYLGKLPGMDNFFVAAGHFRSGLQMSPATARVMRQLILGQDLDFSLDGLECDRNS